MSRKKILIAMTAVALGIAGAVSSAQAGGKAVAAPRSCRTKPSASRARNWRILPGFCESCPRKCVT